MEHRKLVFACFAVCLLLMVAACQTEHQTTEDPASSEPLTLYVYSNSGDSIESWNERFGNALKEKFPNYTIEYIPKTDKVGLSELITAGQRIDIFWESIGGFSTYLLGHDLQYDMAELIEKHGIDVNRFEQTSIDAIKQISGEQRIYGIPVFNNTMVMYYNKDLFDKFGVEYPQDGLTWSEAAELSKRLTRFEDDNIYAGLSTSETHMLLMNQLSLPFVDPETQKATLDQDERWKTFYETVFVKPAQGSGYREYMQAHDNKLPYRKEFLEAQDLAMFAWLSSIIFVFPEEFSSMNWDVIAMPTFEDLPGIGSQAYPTYFSVTNMAENKDAAMEVIKYLVSDEMQTALSKMGVMPILDDEEIRSVFGSESMFADKNLAAAFYNEFAPISYKSDFDRTLVTPYAKAAPRVVLEGDDNTIFREYAEESNQKIAELLGK